MSKLLYIAFRDFSKEHQGSLRKIKAQCRAFSRCGYDVLLLGRYKGDLYDVLHETRLTSHGVPSSAPSALVAVVAKWRQCLDIISFIKDRSYDACYVRYEFSDGFLIKMLSRLSKKCSRIALELPTWPYEGELSDSKLGKVKLQIDRYYRRRLSKYVGLIVSFYEMPKTLFNIPTKQIPNGFDFDSVSPANETLDKDCIHVAAVSSMRPWHGYERFIEGLYEYYRSGGDRNIVLHLVGDGPEKKKYEALVSKYKLASHVSLEGPLSGSRLDGLLERCDLGIDSLARHRSGISVLSSLKSREYGAKGIPFLNSCKIDVIEGSCPYVLYVSPSEDPIDIASVIKFRDSLYCSRDRCDLARDIHEYFALRCDMYQTLLPVMEWFHS